VNRALLLSGTALVLSGIWILPVCDPSEARYAEVAREMLAGGDWLVPHLMGRVHLSKPPLTYWLAALSMETFGESAPAARLPSALAFLLTVLVVADLGRRLWGDGAGGREAGWAFLFSALPLGAASILTTDATVAFLETAMVWCGWRSATAPSPASGRPWALGFHSAMALGLLSKGPPALLSVAALLVFAIRHRGRYAFGRLLAPGALCLFAVLVGSWVAAVYLTVPGVLRYWWETEVVKRVAGDSGRNMSFWLYFPILLGGTLPAGVLFPAAARWLWRQFKARGPDRPPAELLILWIAIPLLVLCLARSRLPLYLLPLFPPLALVLGRWMALRWGGRQPSGRLAVALVAAMATLVAGARAAAPHLGRAIQPDPRPIARAIADDARRLRSGMETFFTCRITAVPACGLAFYLKRPLEELDLGAGDQPASPTAPRRAAELLASPPPAGTAQYFLVRTSDRPLFEERAAGQRGEWLLEGERLLLWRRGG
jgi:4-amino-4-deoxy-L-arabinose transferase-like glycosyltransferase